MGWIASLAAVAFVGAVYYFLGWQGMVGGIAGIMLCETSDRLKNGYWTRY